MLEIGDWREMNTKAARLLTAGFTRKKGSKRMKKVELNANWDSASSSVEMFPIADSTAFPAARSTLLGIVGSTIFGELTAAALWFK